MPARVDSRDNRTNGGIGLDCASGCGDCAPLAFLGMAVACALGGSIIAGQYANAARNEAVTFKAKQMEAEQRGDTKVAKSFSIASTESRIRTVAHGFFTAGLALFTLTLIGTIVHFCGPNLFDKYLLSGAEAVGGLMTAGALTYGGARAYAYANREEISKARKAH